MATQINGKPIDIYIGIDVHLKSWTVSICTKSLIHKTFSQPPEVSALCNYLERNFPGANYHSVYEAGFSGFWLHKALESRGINNIVVNACDVPTTDKEKRQKRDQVDSLKLARSLRSGDLRGIYIPSQDEQYHRSLTRLRGQLVSDISRFKQRIKSSLHYYGIQIPEAYLRSKGYWTKKFKEWLSDLESAPKAIHHQLQALETLQERLKCVNKEITELSKQQTFKEPVRLITTIPGISVISGMILLTEIADISRFKRVDDLCSYVGLVPNIYASGEKEKTGRMTKRSNRRIVKVLIESSWVAIKKDPALAMAYEKLKLRMHGNKAIIRIARKMLSRIKYVLTNNEPYQLGLVG